MRLRTGHAAAGVDNACLLTNEDINFRILAELRTSEIVVADPTGQRGGVYFEAGFALALGSQVFWTCKKSELSQVLFDTNHFQYIDWENADDLRDRLGTRLLP
jgi:nucleoside 2-deoxyribosyltransferase